MYLYFKKELHIKPFYRKNYRTVELTYSVEQTNGSGATIAPQGEFRWLTTNTGEGDNFTTGDTEASTVGFKRVAPAVLSAQPASGSAVTSATSVYKYTWDMTQYTTGASPVDSWENRIITGLEFTLHTISHSSGEHTVVTDIDNIKIST